MGFNPGGSFNFTSVNPVEGDRPAPRVQVSVGTVGFTDAAALYNEDPTSIFTDVICNVRLEQDRHVMMMPLASPTGFNGGAAAFVQLAAPTTLKLVDFTVARLNQPPIVPSPQSLDPDWILLDAMPETAVLTVAMDGTTPLYRVSGVLVYGRVNPSDNVFNDLTFARPPFLKDLFPAGRKMPSSNLDPTLVDILGATLTAGGSVGAGAGGSFGGVPEGPTGGAVGGGGGGAVGGGGGGSFG